MFVHSLIGQQYFQPLDFSPKTMIEFKKDYERELKDVWTSKNSNET